MKVNLQKVPTTLNGACLASFCRPLLAKAGQGIIGRSGHKTTWCKTQVLSCKKLPSASCANDL